MFEIVTHNPAVGPNGETFAVRITLSSGGVCEKWYWTAGDALEARDRAYLFGFLHVRVIGLPTVVAGA